MLAVREQLPLFPEPVESNPYLTKFYENPSRYAFAMQTFLLHARFKQAQEAQELDMCVMDMSMYGNDIFAQLQYKHKHMDMSDFMTYRDITRTFKGLVKPPKLMVYLQCSVQVAVQRIMKRGRSSELQATNQYWFDLNKEYENWYNNYSDSKKICINVDHLNYVDDHSDEDYIIDMIMEAL